VNIPGLLHEVTDEVIDRTLDVNVKGQIDGASVMLTKGIALDFAKQGIRCNVICPGWVGTPINHAYAAMMGGLQKVYDTIDSFQPIGRPGEPREIAKVALFLASDEASLMTGSVVLVDGGMTAQ